METESIGMAEQIAQLVDRLGLASATMVVGLVALFWTAKQLRKGAVQFFVWSKPVVEKTVNKHLETLDRVCETQQALCHTQEVLLERSLKHVEALDQVCLTQQKLCLTQEKLADTVTSLAIKVETMDRGKTIDDIHLHVTASSKNEEKILDMAERLLESKSSIGRNKPQDSPP